MLSLLLGGCGLAMMMIALQIIAILTDFFDIVETHGFLRLDARFSVVLGIFVIVFALMGLKAALTQTKRNLYTVFAIGELVSVSFILHLVFSVISYYFLGSEMKIIQSLDSYSLTDQAWNQLQLQFECCGIKGPSDWTETPFGDYQLVPDQCCLNFYPGCASQSDITLYSIGCEKAFEVKINTKVIIVESLAFVQLVFSIAIFIIALKLATNKSLK